jgi:hypothetical protein
MLGFVVYTATPRFRRITSACFWPFSVIFHPVFWRSSTKMLALDRQNGNHFLTLKRLKSSFARQKLSNHPYIFQWVSHVLFLIYKNKVPAGLIHARLARPTALATAGVGKSVAKNPNRRPLRYASRLNRTSVPTRPRTIQSKGGRDEVGQGLYERTVGHLLQSGRALKFTRVDAAGSQIVQLLIGPDAQPLKIASPTVSRSR